MLNFQENWPNLRGHCAGPGQAKGGDRVDEGLRFAEGEAQVGYAQFGQFGAGAIWVEA